VADIKEFEFATLEDARSAATGAGVADENVLAILEGYVNGAAGMDRGRASIFVYADEQVLEVTIRAQVWPNPSEKE